MSDAPALMVIGAHPDDCEITAAGVAALTAERGGRVLFVSLTNGDKGHQTLGGATLARRRRDEAHAAAEACGAKAVVLDNHDGELTPTLERRYELIRVIREFRPDLVMFPRPWDYHPDHRYTAQIAQDAMYMVRVPSVCPHIERLEADPIAMYVSDGFQKPYPLQADVVLDIGPVLDQKLEAMACHVSQMFEWIPFVGGNTSLRDIPNDPEGRRAYLRRQWDARLRRDADRFRSQLLAAYGAERGANVVYAEAFEVCEFGAPLTAAARNRFFPF
ncbi:MAG TPA: PIG-L deacetylase family protein [Roseiarcus sp.]|nr:PIG-L deacetylase family protein [Roseiarcus sp.]